MSSSGTNLGLVGVLSAGAHVPADRPAGPDGPVGGAYRQYHGATGAQNGGEWAGTVVDSPLIRSKNKRGTASKR